MQLFPEPRLGYRSRKEKEYPYPTAVFTTTTIMAYLQNTSLTATSQIVMYMKITLVESSFPAPATT